eukprot:2346751-Lingulodinium_polyedra.AAC.1
MLPMTPRAASARTSTERVTLPSPDAAGRRGRPPAPAAAQPRRGMPLSEGRLRPPRGPAGRRRGRVSSPTPEELGRAAVRR